MLSSPCPRGCSDNYCCFVLLTEIFFSAFERSRGKVLNRNFEKIITLETNPLPFWDSLSARGMKGNHCLQKLYLKMFQFGKPMTAGFTLLVLGACRACGARNANKLPSFHREHDSLKATTAAMQAVHSRLEINERSLSWLHLEEKSLLWFKCSFSQTVFSGVPLAQWILNGEVATATLLGCWKNPSGTRPHDCPEAYYLLVCNFFTGSLMKSTLPLCLFQKLSTFLKEMTLERQ